MTLNAVRSLVTLISLLLFVALMIWTWWPARRGEHESASQLVFERRA